jgi:hypothetical protein
MCGLSPGWEGGRDKGGEGFGGRVKKGWDGLAKDTRTRQVRCYSNPRSDTASKA